MSRLGELRELEKAASPRPWVAKTFGAADGPQIAGPHDTEWWQASVCNHGTPANGGGGLDSDVDAELIAVMRNLLPDLLDVVEAMNAHEVDFVCTLLDGWPTPAHWQPDRTRILRKLQNLRAALAHLEADAIPHHDAVPGGEGRE